MAKKNSSKTATEKALSISEPKIQVFTGWQGVNFKEAPLGWEPLETGWKDFRTSDLKPNYLLVQNNLVTCDSLTVETRPDSESIGVIPSDSSVNQYVNYEDGWRFTGVSCLFHRWLFCVVRMPIHHESGTPAHTFLERIIWRDITEDDVEDWNVLSLRDAEVEEHSGLDPEGYEIREIGYYEDNLIATVWHQKDDVLQVHPYEGEVFKAKLNYRKTWHLTDDGIKLLADTITPKGQIGVTWINGILTSPVSLPDPGTPPSITFEGVESSPTYTDGMITRFEVKYTLTNEYGSTLPSNGTVIWAKITPQEMSYKRYMVVSGVLPQYDTSSTTPGIDVYVTVDNNTEYAFIGHAVPEDRTPGSAWTLIWDGVFQDVSAWTNKLLKLPEDNTTKGVPATHFAVHDSRLYWWGDPRYPYRLYIGGDPGNELSVARGLGGAFIDIEPGTGYEINGTAKWKTVAGASIVTIMSGNPNTNMVKRFNLVETNTTITNEDATKGYMYEEVSNVIGCNSRWGYGVFADGLYSVSRYGVMLTTMAMEYNSQMRNQQISDVIQPIFTERMGNRLKDCRMVYIDGVLYLILSEDNAGDEPTNLDQVILCYDIDLKAWYTFTHDLVVPGHGDEVHGEKLLHAMAIDSDEHHEGLGVITDYDVRLYPTTGIQEETSPEFNVIMETGEISSRKPNQDHHYVCQLELHFDYFIGQADVIVEGVDYYGRPFTVNKKLNRKDIDGTLRDWVEWIRIDRYVESYRIRIIGKARFRLVSINAKAYTVSKKVGLVYGYDDHNHYRNRHGGSDDNHHYIRDYNNLRKTLVP